MKPVSKRCTFYVSGFDPKGAAHYHALYRDESARQTAVDGLRRDVGGRRRLPSGNAAWTVKALCKGATVETHYEFMRWDDVVRQHWPKSTWALWRDVLATTAFYLRHGAWWKMFRLSWPPAVAVFTPFLLVCAMLAGVPLLALASAVTATGMWGSVWLGIGTGGLCAAVLWFACRRLEARYSMYWMMRSYAFTAQQAQGRVPDLEDRLERQALCLVDRVRAQADDEVLLVGHSSGAIMAASILARALRLAPDLLAGRTQVALLTLGQWIPLLGLLPMARPFRAELRLLDQAKGLTWIDFSAPPDGCCFALTDPITGSGVDRQAAGGVELKLLNPRFAALFDPLAYAQLKRDKFQLHFQYLRATGKPGDYNYFEMTAGAQTLASRFADAPSVMDFSRFRIFGSRG